MCIGVLDGVFDEEGAGGALYEEADSAEVRNAASPGEEHPNHGGAEEDQEAGRNEEAARDH